MATIDILVGTTSGNTEYLADQLSEQLEQNGHTTRLHYEPDYTELTQKLTQESLWLACIASHGAGDYGDSMLDFADDLQQQQADLEPLRYAVIAIGDSCYDTFCKAGRDFDHELEKRNAKPLLQRLEIDMANDDPEEKASTWLNSFLHQL